jgi:RimJ/RimL family protein N-acetyltransferase
MGMLRDKGAVCIKAGVEAGNSASIALLEKLGFRYSEICNGERIYILAL